MSIVVSVINRKINHVCHMRNMEFCKVLQRRYRYTVCHFTTKEEISTVLAEKFGSEVEGEEGSQPRYASTFFSELSIISVMALIRFAVFYCLWIHTELTKNFLLETDGSLCMQ